MDSAAARVVYQHLCKVHSLQEPTESSLSTLTDALAFFCMRKGEKTQGTICWVGGGQREKLTTTFSQLRLPNLDLTKEPLTAKKKKGGGGREESFNLGTSFLVLGSPSSGAAAYF